MQFAGLAFFFFNYYYILYYFTSNFNPNQWWLVGFDLGSMIKNCSFIKSIEFLIFNETKWVPITFLTEFIKKNLNTIDYICRYTIYLLLM